jgi:hypothetical protein
MKQLVWRLVIPLTVISFAIFTKWWYTLPVDAPDTVFYGFPFAYTCNGWHTSMSIQVFILEMVADLLIYFIAWFVLIFMINRYIKTITLPRIITGFLLFVTVIITAHYMKIAVSKDNIFYVRRNFEMEIIKTGYKFIWEAQPAITTSKDTTMSNSLHLVPGKKYKVIKEFTDYDSLVHPIGETWIFEETHFLPYDDGLTLHVKKDTTQLVYRLQWRKEQQAGIIENFHTYVEPVERLE